MALGVRSSRFAQTYEYSLSSDRSIIVTGYVDDLAPFFNGCRLSVAPLRYGAGVKGKILTSLSYGVPVVASSIACEGIGLENEVDVLSADEAADFAACVIRLYNDPVLWNSLSANGLENMRKNYSMSSTTEAFQRLFASLEETRKPSFQTIRNTHQLPRTKVAVR